MARGLSKTYQMGEVKVHALLDVDLTVYRGEFIVLLGPSGSGKSTLLHLMAALDTPSTGKLEWPALGTREQLLPNKIALAFQSPSLLAPLTVAENVALPLIYAGVGAGERKQIALDALAQAARPLRPLSQGLVRACT